MEQMGEDGRRAYITIVTLPDIVREEGEGEKRS